jgi:transcriptional accessory protein Tex/SPT6
MELESRYATLAGELNCSPGQVRAVGLLLAEGATVPFIARYRKEATGSWTRWPLRPSVTGLRNWRNSTSAGRASSNPWRNGTS